MGQLVPIKLPPGMFANGTQYESAGRWFVGNLVRWENGRLKPIGGWQAVTGGVLIGIARGGISFTDNLGFSYTLIGTNSDLYLSEGGTYTRSTPALTPPFVAGRVDSILGAGYGAGVYGSETYGTARSVATLQLNATTWQFDIFGNTAVMVQNTDRRLLQFDPSAGTIVVPAGSPTCIGVMTTNEDFILVIGAGGNGRRIAWPDVGTTTIWTPTDINSAGDIDLNTQGLGVAGTRVGLQNLVWTTTDVHLINYVGQPAIYAPTRIGTACGLIGPRAWAIAASGAGAGEAAYWMSRGGFFQYNGAVIPMQCEVQDLVWANINFKQAAKIYASTNSRFHEVIWFFPSLASNECDSYVIYNYKDNLWYYGLQSTLARTTYLDLGPIPLPLGVDAAGIVYQHETGYLANGATRVGQVFARSGPAEIGNGDQIIYANMMLIDGDGIVDASGNNVLTMTPQTRNAPLGPLGPNIGPIALKLTPEGYTPVMISGRQVALRFDITQDVGWALGKFRLNVSGGSKR
jgi:hypothetical protein